MLSSSLSQIGYDVICAALDRAESERVAKREAFCTNELEQWSSKPCLFKVVSLATATELTRSSSSSSVPTKSATTVSAPACECVVCVVVGIVSPTLRRGRDGSVSAFAMLIVSDETRSHVQVPLWQGQTSIIRSLGLRVGDIILLVGVSPAMQTAASRAAAALKPASEEMGGGAHANAAISASSLPSASVGSMDSIRVGGPWGGPVCLLARHSSCSSSSENTAAHDASANGTTRAPQHSVFTATAMKHGEGDSALLPSRGSRVRFGGIARDESIDAHADGGKLDNHSSHVTCFHYLLRDFGDTRIIIEGGMAASSSSSSSSSLGLKFVASMAIKSSEEVFAKCSRLLRENLAGHLWLSAQHYFFGQATTGRNPSESSSSIQTSSLSALSFFGRFYGVLAYAKSSMEWLDLLHPTVVGEDTSSLAISVSSIAGVAPPLLLGDEIMKRKKARTPSTSSSSSLLTRDDSTIRPLPSASFAPFSLLPTTTEKVEGYDDYDEDDDDAKEEGVNEIDGKKKESSIYCQGDENEAIEERKEKGTTACNRNIPVPLETSSTTGSSKFENDTSTISLCMPMASQHVAAYMEQEASMLEEGGQQLLQSTDPRSFFSPGGKPVRSQNVCGSGSSTSDQGRGTALPALSLRAPGLPISPALPALQPSLLFKNAMEMSRAFEERGPIMSCGVVCSVVSVLAASGSASVYRVGNTTCREWVAVLSLPSVSPTLPLSAAASPAQIHSLSPKSPATTTGAVAPCSPVPRVQIPLQIWQFGHDTFSQSEGRATFQLLLESLKRMTEGATASSKSSPSGGISGASTTPSTAGASECCEIRGLALLRDVRPGRSGGLVLNNTPHTRIVYGGRYASPLSSAAPLAVKKIAAVGSTAGTAPVTTPTSISPALSGSKRRLSFDADERRVADGGASSAPSHYGSNVLSHSLIDLATASRRLKVISAFVVAVSWKSYSDGCEADGKEDINTISRNGAAHDSKGTTATKGSNDSLSSSVPTLTSSRIPRLADGSFDVRSLLRQVAPPSLQGIKTSSLSSHWMYAQCALRLQVAPTAAAEEEEDLAGIDSIFHGADFEALASDEIMQAFLANIPASLAASFCLGGHGEESEEGLLLAETSRSLFAQDLEALLHALVKNASRPFRLTLSCPSNYHTASSDDPVQIVGLSL